MRKSVRGSAVCREQAWAGRESGVRNEVGTGQWPNPAGFPGQNEDKGGPPRTLRGRQQGFETTAHSVEKGFGRKSGGRETRREAAWWQVGMLVLRQRGGRAGKGEGVFRPISRFLA